MKKWLTLITVVAALATLSGGAFAQGAAETATAKSAKAKVDDLGLKNSTLPSDVSDELGLSADQKKKIKAADEKTTKSVEKVKEDIKKLGSHQHGAGGACPHCIMATKMKEIYTEYHTTLGTILNSSQKSKVKALMAAKTEQERKPVASGS